MRIFDYTTAGGKNLILDHIEALPPATRAEAFAIRIKIMEEGIEAFAGLRTRQLRGKLYEIKFSQERIMYVIASREEVYFLHICKKQKGKAEAKDIEKALQRARREGLL